MLNNNFSKLIKLYEKYQKQQRNKLFIQILAAAVIVASVYFIVTRYMQQQKEPVQAPAPTVQSTHHTPQTNITAPRSEKPVHPPVSVPKTAVATPKAEPMPKEVTRRKPSKTKKEEPFQLKITQRESLYNMLVAYKDKKTYTTAIKIAQFYLLQKEYEKAVKWAVEASKKDPAQAQSWIIYAKAKKALGKPDVAKRALTIYLKHNYSQSAQDLLDSL